jgi:hypothetical protein
MKIFTVAKDPRCASLPIHIKPDWLLIYMTDEDRIIFERTGTHSDLFALKLCSPSLSVKRKGLNGISVPLFLNPESLVKIP